MSYHILHITDFGCKLSKERGMLVCKKDSKEIGRIAIEDLRAVVILNEANSISGSLLAELADIDAVIIHCKNFKPVGVTLPNLRTYDAKVVLNQSAGNRNLNSAIWRRLLYAKIANNVNCLKNMGVVNSRMEQMFLNSKTELNEAWFAREYWKHYFPKMGELGGRRDPQDESSKINVLLNYGYGILGGIIHRSIIVSGLNYLLGVNHKTYYRNTPLVYDVIEPFRAFVDYALYKYVLSSDVLSIRMWSVFFGKFLKEYRVQKAKNSLKLLDSVDIVCESLANVYRYKKADFLWTPILNL